jgi:hypothetical protein
VFKGLSGHVSDMSSVGRRKVSATDGIEEAVFAGSGFEEGLYVLAASAAAAGVLQSEPSFDLAWQQNTRARGVADL